MGFTAATRVSETESAHAGYMERYTKSLAKQAVAGYAAVAKKHGLTPTQLALAWCKVRACHAAIQEGSCQMGLAMWLLFIHASSQCRPSTPLQASAYCKNSSLGRPFSE